MELSELTPAEARVWQAFPQGESVDFRTDPDEDAATGAGWGPERTVRASVLKALLIGAPQKEGEIAALRLQGARITEALDLKYGVIEHAVRLSHCHFDVAPDLYGSRLRQLSLTGSVLPSIRCNNAQINGHLRMTECRVRGPVRLDGTRIAGALFMDGAELTTSKPSVPVLHLNQAVIGHGLWAPRLRVRGEARLNGAEIVGLVDFESAEFDNPGSTSLSAQS